MNKKTPIDRLNYSGSLSPIVDRICATYKLGQPTEFFVIEMGYEDCNVFIETSANKYVAKIFSKVRSQADITRYVVVMEKVIEAGINHPQLMKFNEDEVLYQDKKVDGISLVLMKFIEGKNFIELGRVTNADELNKIIEQAVKIGKIDYQSPYLFDSWAIPNIQILFEKVRQFIQPDDLRLIEQVVECYLKIPVDKLPHCFVHGDFTKSNVIRGTDGNIYILDFSISNWYPRIQEIAVIAANLLYNRNDYTTLQERIELVLSEYEKLVILTPEEKQHIYSYSLAGIAMEFLGAYQEKFIKNNDSEETEFWLNLGRDGLKRELE